MERSEIEECKDDYKYISIIGAAKRVGLRWSPWAGDQFVSWSPLNHNSHAEGGWDHWVELAIKILQNPLTTIVRPDAVEAVKNLKTHELYDDVKRELSEDEIVEYLAMNHTEDEANIS